MAQLQISQPVGAFLRECQTFLDSLRKDQRDTLTALELMMLGTYVRQVRIVIKAHRSVKQQQAE